MEKHSSIVLCLGLFATIGVSQPQMGWNSWNKFACDISEDLIKETVDAMVSSGLKDIGYNYINIDDCWQANERDENGRILADPIRFPSGMKALGDYIHSKGLLFGIYSSAGFKTCQGYPASLGLEQLDADVYASWGVDYLKYDNCYQDHGVPESRYGYMAKALKKAGATAKSDPIFYSLCEWGRQNPAVWAGEIGASSWRISADIRDEWMSIIKNAAITYPLWRYSGGATAKGGWNDPDMLEVGNGGCSDEEYRSHFSMWAMLKAPLLTGNDLRTTTDATLNILTNKEVIGVNQDSLRLQSKVVWSDISDKLSKSAPADKLIATKCSSSDSGGYSDNALDQTWRVLEDGTIQSVTTSLCLHEGSLSNSTTIESPWFSSPETSELELPHVVTTTDCNVATKWDTAYRVGGSIVSRSTGRCLEVNAEVLNPLWQGKRLQTSKCSPQHGMSTGFDVTEHQSWTMPNGRLLNLYQRQCLTVDRDAYASSTFTGSEVWAVPLKDGYAILLLNKAPIEQSIQLQISMLDIVRMQGDNTRIFKLRDLWAHEDLERRLTDKNAITMLVPSHGVKMLKLVSAAA